MDKIQILFREIRHLSLDVSLSDVAAVSRYSVGQLERLVLGGPDSELDDAIRDYLKDHSPKSDWKTADDPEFDIDAVEPTDFE